MKTTGQTLRKEDRHPAVQIWPSEDAPQLLDALLEPNDGYDWVALVPPSLNDPELIDLLLKNGASRPLKTICLPNGGVLLAGHYSETVAYRGGRPQARSGVRKNTHPLRFF